MLELRLKVDLRDGLTKLEQDEIADRMLDAALHEARGYDSYAAVTFGGD
jgi:hypothetical protein